MTSKNIPLTVDSKLNIIKYLDSKLLTQKQKYDILKAEQDYKNLSVTEPEDILMDGLDYRDYSDDEEDLIYLTHLIL